MHESRRSCRDSALAQQDAIEQWEWPDHPVKGKKEGLATKKRDEEKGLLNEMELDGDKQEGHKEKVKYGNLFTMG